MKTTQTLHTARLNNNCPTCFATDGLELTFSQEKQTNTLYDKTEKEINSKMYCHTCGHDIFPVSWTDDIERVYDYHKKLATPSSTGIRPKPLLYILMLVAVIVVAGIVYYFIS
ncbi:MAG: hypothetical protein CMC70_06725 [Flavobacteriaceae bacterium]|nr:hypothetical protein [Flavobacteriaceae bacterium]|tara:strand:+ start:1173 stop:1511 length:339 start_codon:yes stop_codon:yes gene_type:complete